MKVPYPTFMKHALKVTKDSPASRPLLKGVHHALGGSLIVTDSHRLYVAKEAHDRKDEVTIDPKDGAEIQGEYPGVSRLIPKSDPQFTVELNIHQATKALKALQHCGKVSDKEPLVELIVSAEGGSFSIISEAIVASYRLEVGASTHKRDSDDKITFRIRYLLEALNVFKDAGISQATLFSYGRVRPFIVKESDDFLALLLPVRTSH